MPKQDKYFFNCIILSGTVIRFVFKSQGTSTKKYTRIFPYKAVQDQYKMVCLLIFYSLTYILYHVCRNRINYCKASNKTLLNTTDAVNKKLFTSHLSSRNTFLMTVTINIITNATSCTTCVFMFIRMP